MNCVTGMSYSWLEFVDLRFILGPLLLHVVLAALLRRWLFPHAADRCVWLSTYITFSAIGWYLFGWTFDVDNLIATMPHLMSRMTLFVKLQWYLLIYFFLSSQFAHKKSNTGWVIMRKFVPVSILMICYLYKWDPPSMTIRFIYLIIQFTVVDVGVDLYHLVKALKDMADVNENGELKFVGWILDVLYPVLVVSWASTIYNTYNLITDYGILWGYGVIGMQIAIQLCVLLPIRFKK